MYAWLPGPFELSIVGIVALLLLFRTDLPEVGPRSGDSMIRPRFEDEPERIDQDAKRLLIAVLLIALAVCAVTGLWEQLR